MTAHFPASSIQKNFSFVLAYSTAVQLFNFVKGFKIEGNMTFKQPRPIECLIVALVKVFNWNFLTAFLTIRNINQTLGG